MAIKYRLSDAIVSSSNAGYLELTVEQMDRIKKLHDAFATHYNELLDATWGIKSGAFIDDNTPPPISTP